jgi:hypothetical protein
VPALLVFRLIPISTRPNGFLTERGHKRPSGRKGLGRSGAPRLWPINAHAPKLFRSLEQPTLAARLFFICSSLVREPVQLLAGHFMRLARSSVRRLLWPSPGQPDLDEAADGFRSTGLIFLPK